MKRVEEKKNFSINLKKVDFIQIISESNKNLSPKASHNVSANMHSHFGDSKLFSYFNFCSTLHFPMNLFTFISEQLF